MKPEEHPLLGPVIKTTSELAEFNKVAFEDFDECKKHLDADWGNQFWRRTAVRIFAAHIEGHAYLMKQCVLRIIPVLKVNFSEGEIASLKEVAFKVDEQGNVEERGDNWIPFVNNFRFACRCFVKVHRSTMPLDYSVHGFECFKAMVKIRDRLMHPKAKADMTITDDEAEKIAKAWNWIQQHMRLIFNECDRARKEFFKNLAAQRKNPKV